jgi:type I restriction enzyme S subunit
MEVKAGYRQTDVGIIPDDWEAVPIDSVARRGSGHTPNKKHPEYWNGDIKWISLADSDRLDALYINDTSKKITTEGIANSSAVQHPIGTVILSRDAGIGKSAIMMDSMAVSQHFIAWTCGSRLDNHYLYYWLQSKKTEFERISDGSTIKTIGLQYFKDLQIPLPIIVEQRAISTALSDVDAFITSLERLISKKRDIKHAAMQELLTGKQRLPGFSSKWEEKRLGDVGKCIRGVSYNGDSDLSLFDTNNTIRLLRANNVQNAKVVKNNLQYVTSERVTPQQVMRYEDILICMANGSKELVGKAGLFLIDDEFDYSFGTFMGCFRNDRETTHPIFIFFLLQTEQYRNSISILLSGSSINNLKPSDIESIEFLIPRMDEQIAIITILTDIESEIAILERRRDKTKAIKQGMIQELLTGRIRLT